MLAMLMLIVRSVFEPSTSRVGDAPDAKLTDAAAAANEAPLIVAVTLLPALSGNALAVPVTGMSNVPDVTDSEDVVLPNPLALYSNVPAILVSVRVEIVIEPAAPVSGVDHEPVDGFDTVTAPPKICGPAPSGYVLAPPML